jgi:hypothetical protein
MNDIQVTRIERKYVPLSKILLASNNTVQLMVSHEVPTEYSREHAHELR